MKNIEASMLLKAMSVDILFRINVDEDLKKSRSDLMYATALAMGSNALDNLDMNYRTNGSTEDEKEQEDCPGEDEYDD